MYWRSWITHKNLLLIGTIHNYQYFHMSTKHTLFRLFKMYTHQHYFQKHNLTYEDHKSWQKVVKVYGTNILFSIDLPSPRQRTCMFCISWTHLHVFCTNMLKEQCPSHFKMFTILFVYYNTMLTYLQLLNALLPCITTLMTTLKSPITSTFIHQINSILNICTI